VKGSNAENLIAILRDPLRRAIMNNLSIGPASAAELASDLDVPVEQVRYQIKRLRAAEIVTIHEERERRGAVERTFIADSRKLALPGDEIFTVSSQRLQDYNSNTLQAMFREAVEAARAGATRRNERHFILRIPLMLDGEGFREVGKLFEGAVTRLFELREESLARLETSGEKPQPGTSALLFFEMPD
jgi:DNA-binding transcriptional ArsR family regulator